MFRNTLKGSLSGRRSPLRHLSGQNNCLITRHHFRGQSAPKKEGPAKPAPLASDDLQIVSDRQTVFSGGRHLNKTSGDHTRDIQLIGNIGSG